MTQELLAEVVVETPQTDTYTDVEKSSWIVDAIKTRVMQHNRDYLILFSGKKGSGKSYSCMALLEKVDPTFGIDRIVFTAKDFIELIRSDMPKGSALMWDEVGVEFNSRQWWQLINKVINDHILLMRTKRYIVGVTIPSINMMDSQGRQHVVSYVECLNANKKKRYVVAKFFRVQVNSRSGDFYYKYYFNPQGEQEKRTYFPKPSKKLIRAYEEKRAAFFTHTSDEDVKKLIAFEEKEKEKSSGYDVSAIVEKVWANIGKYTKVNLNGTKSVEWYGIMEDFKIGHVRAKRVRYLIEKRLAEAAI